MWKRRCETRTMAKKKKQAANISLSMQEHACRLSLCVYFMCLLYVYGKSVYFISSTLLFRNLSSASPFSMPFCSKARSMS